MSEPSPKERLLAAAKPYGQAADSAPYIDAPFIELGQLARLYARRNGYVVCDDLLRDRRHVSVVLTWDNPSQIASLLAAHGYRSYVANGLTYLCQSLDPFDGADVRLVAADYQQDQSAGVQLHHGPVIAITWQGRRHLYYLADVLTHNRMTAVYVDCAYQLRTADGRVVRTLSDQQCLRRVAQAAEGRLQPPPLASTEQAAGAR